MARQARVIVPGIPHHITHRGNLRAQVFFSDDNRTWAGSRAPMILSAVWNSKRPAGFARRNRARGISFVIDLTEDLFA